MFRPEPLDYYYGNTGLKYTSLFDIDWMYNKGLKWIASDKHNYRAAWADSKGMIYRIKDLPRSEKGKEKFRPSRVSIQACVAAPGGNSSTSTSTKNYR